MRPSRNVLLLAFLIAALAAQRIVAHPTTWSAVTTPEATQVARRLIRRIARNQFKPGIRALMIAPRLSLRRFATWISPLVSAVFQSARLPPALLPCPPPLLA